MWPVLEDLIQFAPPPSGIVLVNHHVYFSTEETERVIFVHGVAFAHYDVSGRAAEAYAMVSLFESGYANQKNIARAFGVSARSLRRYQEHLEAGGLAALARADGRPSASRSDPPKKRERDRTILHLKAKGFSSRATAGKLGLDEKAIPKRLHLLGWAPCPEPSSAFPEESGIPAGKELHIKIAPLSSPHRSLAIAALCETLNQTNTPFPGTSLAMLFSVEKHVSDAKSGQVP